MVNAKTIVFLFVVMKLKIAKYPDVPTVIIVRLLEGKLLLLIPWYFLEQPHFYSVLPQVKCILKKQLGYSIIKTFART